MVGCMTAFTLNDACMKLLGANLPLMQVLFLRGIAVTVFLVWLAHNQGQWIWRMPRRDWGWILLRSASEGAAVVFFMTALINMDIADLSAILQALPLTVTLAGALFFGERVGWRRLAAILIGFIGVLMIVKPGTEAFTIHALYGVMTVILVTIRDVAARKLSKAAPSLMVSFVASVFVTGVAGVGAVQETWMPITGVNLWLLFGAASFVVWGYILSVSSMRVGEIGFVAPFRYTSLVVAMILGVVVFGTFPDALTLLGAAIVVATGLFTLLREWQLRRAGRAKATEPTTIPARHRGL